MTDLDAALEDTITHATGRPFRIERRTRAGGGCINEAMTVEGGGRRYFIKLNEASREDMFAAEMAGLDALRESAVIRVPEPLGHGTTDGRAFLVMEYLELGGREDPARFGERLAALHRHTAERFGFHHDNTIGSTPQPNAWMDDWIAFMRERRLGHQLALARRRGASSRILAAVERVIADLPAFFAGYRPVPSVLHGDLWSGNWGYDERGEPVIFDPATYFGDREADIAMTELFGSPGRGFRDGYDAVWPLDAGYPVRRDLYNLYHILNHFNLFGGGYGEQAARMAGRLVKEMGDSRETPFTGDYS